jgi:hypothetical protein
MRREDRELGLSGTAAGDDEDEDDEDLEDDGVDIGSTVTESGDGSGGDYVHSEEDLPAGHDDTSDLDVLAEDVRSSLALDHGEEEQEEEEEEEVEPSRPGESKKARKKRLREEREARLAREALLAGEAILSSKETKGSKKKQLLPVSAKTADEAVEEKEQGDGPEEEGHENEAEGSAEKEFIVELSKKDRRRERERKKAAAAIAGGSMLASDDVPPGSEVCLFSFS